jgi:tetratricopeptide (TPR) repeat protein
LRRLTIFAGGWTLEAAEQVCADSRPPNGSAVSDAMSMDADHRSEGLSAASVAESVYSVEGRIKSQDVFELMTQLVAKSLVITNRQLGGERRFHMHGTIHQYAQEKRFEAGEQDNIRSQHLKYFLDLSGLAESALRGPHQIEWYSRLTDERDNLRAALEHASGSDLEAGLILSARLIDYWIDFDWREGYHWSKLLIQNPQSQAFPQARAKALIAQGYLVWDMQQFEAIRSLAEECLADFRSCGDQQGEYDALVLLGRIAQYTEGMAQSVAFHQQALALARSNGDVLRQAFALYNLGRDQRDPQRSREHWEEAITLFRQIGDWRFLAQTLGMLGSTVLSSGDLASAESFLDEASEVNQQINNIEIEYVLTGRGILCMLRGEYDQARKLLQKNLDNHEKTGNRTGYSWGLARLGDVALHEERVTEAYQIMAETIREFSANQNKDGLVFAMDKMAILYVVRGKPDIAARIIGWSDANRRRLAYRVHSSSKLILTRR